MDDADHSQMGDAERQLGRELINRGIFDASEFGDQVFSADPLQTVRFARSRRENMAQIRRACGEVRSQNCHKTASCPGGRQGGEPLSAIFGS
jgi:hypothetical protein